jgi:hypothetical protein
MNEVETRAELIDPQLKERGRGVVEGSKVQREYPMTAGRIQAGGIRGTSLTADYVLVCHGREIYQICIHTGKTFLVFQIVWKLFQSRWNLIRDGREREIQHMIATSFWSADGRLISVEEFLQGLFGVLPEYFRLFSALSTTFSQRSLRSRTIFISGLRHSDTSSSCLSSAKQTYS